LNFKLSNRNNGSNQLKLVIIPTSFQTKLDNVKYTHAVYRIRSEGVWGLLGTRWASIAHLMPNYGPDIKIANKLCWDNVASQPGSQPNRQQL